MRLVQNINRQYPFSILSKEEKLKTLFVKGNSLAFLQRKNVTILLFQLDDFFVEVFKANDNNDVIQIRSFSNSKGLFKYQLSHKEFAKRFMSIKGIDDNN